MLVLSRKKDQKVVLPGLNVTIKVMRCSETSVKLGFEAPSQIRILRDELKDNAEPFDGDALQDVLEESIKNLPSDVCHDTRNKLNTLSIALHVLREDIEAGEVTDVEAAFDKLVQLLTTSRESSPAADDQVNDSQSTSVLLVEDQENEREMLAGILRMHGYQVITANDGVEAIDFLNQNDPPAFVLVDMRMPRGDGASVVRQIRDSSRLSGIRVYVVSGCSENECDLGDDIVDSWHMKPVNPRTLIDSMEINRNN